MDIALLGIFAEVARVGSFASVARQRNVTPSAISRAICSLESELGVRLFHRSTRNVVPTEAGLAYFERVVSLVEDIDQANQIARQLCEAPAGRLRLAAPVAFGQIALAAPLAVFAKAHPDLNFDVIFSDASLDVLQERIDISIQLGPLADSALIAKRLCPIRYVVCASPDYLRTHPVSGAPAELRDHVCIGTAPPDGSDCWLVRSEDGVVTRLGVAPRMRVSNAVMARHWAAAGLGIALLPEFVAWEQLASGFLVRLLDLFEATPHAFGTVAWLVYASGKHLPNKVRLLIDFLVEIFRGAPPWQRAEMPIDHRRPTGLVHPEGLSLRAHVAALKSAPGLVPI
jgi:DNA-binding transcriptional LysR family regulator